jgi:hypothetical protein
MDAFLRHTQDVHAGWRIRAMNCHGWGSKLAEVGLRIVKGFYPSF